MNRFRLPYHLVVEEGVFNDIPGAMKDVFPRLKKSKAILVTEENLKGIFQGTLGRDPERRRSFLPPEACT